MTHPNDASSEHQPAHPHFDTTHLADDLHRHAIRGGAATLSAQGGRFVAQTAVAIALARLLTPEDYGLFGMAFAVVMGVMLFKDIGLPLATVQSPTITHQQASGLFWVNVALGSVLAVVTAGISPWVARFYHDPRLTAPTAAMATILLAVAVTGQHQAILKRQMRFGTLAMIDGVAFFVAGAVALISAWLGAKYWALVAMQIVLAITTAAGAWMACRWRPGRWTMRANIRRLIAFGRYVAGIDVLGSLSGNIDHLAIGWYWGAAPLGFYDKAHAIFLLFVYQLIMPMTSVVEATLSRLVQDTERYRAYLTHSIRITAGLGMPCIVFLFVTADTVIPFVLGPRWTDVVPIYRAIAPAAFVTTCSGAVGWALVSLGATRRLFRWTLLTTTVTVTCLLIALPWGPVAVAAAFSACRLAFLVPSLLFAFRRTPVPWTDPLVAATPPAVAATASALALIAARWFVPASSPLLEIAIDGIGFSACYAILLASLWGIGRTRTEVGLLIRAFQKAATARQ